MIKKLRVSVNGKQYDVTVEMADEAPPAPGAAVSAPVAPAVVSAPTPPPAVARAASSGPGDVPSPLAGRVTAVVVQVGQAVKEGDHLLTLEALKMNTFVYAPRAGTVKDVKVTVGAGVEEGQPLVTIE